MSELELTFTTISIDPFVVFLITNIIKEIMIKILGTLKSDDGDGDGNGNVTKANRFDNHNNNFARVSRLLYFRSCDLEN